MKVSLLGISEAPASSLTDMTTKLELNRENNRIAGM